MYAQTKQKYGSAQSNSPVEDRQFCSEATEFKNRLELMNLLYKIAGFPPLEIE